MVTLQQVKAVQPNWFSPENKRFFGDVSYRVLQGGDGKPYLVRATYQWFDMFRQPKTLWYRVNTINPDLTIGSLVNKQFKDINEVKDWLKTRCCDYHANGGCGPTCMGIPNPNAEVQ